MSLSGRPRAVGNTRGPPGPRARASPSNSTARRHSGTRCSRLAFMRDAGIAHTPAAASTSRHSAPRTSPERPAVSTRNSNASFTTARAPEPRTAATAAATSR